jgi:hypothetical protein
MFYKHKYLGKCFVYAAIRPIEDNPQSGENHVLYKAPIASPSEVPTTSPSDDPKSIKDPVAPKAHPEVPFEVRTAVPSEVPSIMTTKVQPSMLPTARQEAPYKVPTGAPSDAPSIVPNKVIPSLSSIMPAEVQMSIPSKLPIKGTRSTPLPVPLPAQVEALSLSKKVARQALQGLIDQSTTVYQTSSKWPEFIKQCHDNRVELHP